MNVQFHKINRLDFGQSMQICCIILHLKAFFFAHPLTLCSNVLLSFIKGAYSDPQPHPSTFFSNTKVESYLEGFM